jgi:hypothetical protein
MSTRGLIRSAKYSISTTSSAVLTDLHPSCNAAIVEDAEYLCDFFRRGHSFQQC